MAQQENFFSETKTAVQDYIQQRLELIKLQVTEKLSKMAAGIIAGVLIFIFSFFILLFLGIMAGFYFAEITGSNYIGFGIVTGIFILIVVLIIVLKKPFLDKLIIKSLIKSFFNSNNSKHQDETE